MLNVGTQAPDFAAPDQTSVTRHLSDYLGKWVLLYFYPKDNTPGCTTEACTLRDNFSPLSKAGAVVLGVSADSVKSHAGFAEKFFLPFPLISDPDKNIIKAYDADGIIRRVSYLINPDGYIAKAYPKVKPAEHAAEVLRDLAVLAK